jgi:hypothetical protein
MSPRGCYKGLKGRIHVEYRYDIRIVVIVDGKVQIPRIAMQILCYHKTSLRGVTAAGAGGEGRVCSASPFPF